MTKDKAGYKRERGYVLKKFGERVETCHVADVKRALGLTTGLAHNRIDPRSPTKPCPPHLWEMIEEAVRDIHKHRISN